MKDSRMGDRVESQENDDRARKHAPSLNSSQSECFHIPIGRKGEVKLYVGKGCVSAVQVDAIACPQNRYFTLNRGLSKTIYGLLGDQGKERLRQGEMGLPHAEDCVYEIVLGDSNLTCKSIVYFVVTTSKSYEVNKQKLEDAACNILQLATDRKYQSIALPVLGKEEIGNNMPLYICCKSLVSGICKHVYKVESAIKEIYVLDEDSDVVAAFKEAARSKYESLGTRPKDKSTGTGFSTQVTPALLYQYAPNSTSEHPENLKEIHFDNKANRIFGDLVKDSRKGDRVESQGNDDRARKHAPSLNSSQSECFHIPIGRKGEVKLYVGKGCVSAVQVDAIACPQNRYFTLNRGLSNKIYGLLGDRGKERLRQGEKGLPHAEDGVYEIVHGDSNLTCKSIVYFVVTTSKSYEVNKQKLEDAACNILQLATDRKYQSIALPVLGKEEIGNNMPLYICCKSLVSGICKHVYKVESAIKEIYVLDEDSDVVAAFKEAARRKYEYLGTRPKDKSTGTGFSTQFKHSAERQRLLQQSKVLIEMSKAEANAVTKLFQPGDIRGVKGWGCLDDKERLCVTVDTSDKEKVTQAIMNKVNQLWRQECDFGGDVNHFLVAESFCYEAESDKFRNVHFEIIPQESKVIMFGKDQMSVNTATRALYQGIGVEFHMTLPKGDQQPKLDLSHAYDDRDFFVLRHKNIVVKIYHGNITSLQVHAIAVSASLSARNIKGVQGVVMNAAGKDVEKEYLAHCQSDKWSLSNRECKVTSAGNLKYKHLIHVYIQPRDTRSKHSTNLQQFEDAMVNCFKMADTRGLQSIGLPFLGSGNAGFDIPTCAQQYFRAVTSTAWNPQNLKEIHFVSNDGKQVSMLKEIFGILLKDFKAGHRVTSLRNNDQSSKRTPKHAPSLNSSQSECFHIGRYGEVKLYVGTGCVSAVQVDAIACPQNRYFTRKCGLTKTIYNLLDDKGKTLLRNEKGKDHAEYIAYEVPCGVSNLTCKSIMYVVVPMSKNYEEKTPEDACLQLLERSTDRHYQSIALPVLGQEERDNTIGLEICCKSMIRGICKHVNEMNSTIQEMYVIDKSPKVVAAFREAVRRSVICVAE